MEYRIFQDFGASLTTKGYVGLEVINENDKLLTFNDSWQLQAYPIKKITRTEFSGTVNRFCTSETNIECSIHKNTWIYCGLNGSRGFVPCKTVTHVNKPISVGIVPPEHFDVIAFPGIIDFWCLVYGTPINQVRRAYNTGNPLHGVSPLVLFQQLSKEYYSKFFNGLLKLTEKEKKDLFENLLAQEKLDGTKNRIEILFRCLSDTLNFNLLYNTIAKCTCFVTIHRGQVQQFKSVYYKNDKHLLDERGLYAGHLRHNHVKQVETTEVIIETEAPQIVYNTFILRAQL